MTTDKVMCHACIKDQVHFHFLCNFTWDLYISQLFLEVILFRGAPPNSMVVCEDLSQVQADGRNHLVVVT